MRCPVCGAENPPGAAFCINDGTRLTAAGGVSAGAPPQSAAATVLGFFRWLSQERSGAAAAATVFVICAALSFILWVPLSLPPRAIQGIVHAGNCSDLTPGTPAMDRCSVKVGLLTEVGPLFVLVAILVVMFVARRQLMASAQRLTERLPADTRFLVAPIVGTLFFTMSWAGVHYDAYQDSGLLPQKFFPAIVGLYIFATVRYGPALQRRWASFFDARERIPRLVRIVPVILIPIGLSYLMTQQDRVSETGLKEQLVVIVGLVVAYLLIAPRKRDGVPAAPAAGPARYPRV